jgi:Putative GTPases (G3E family)
MAKIPAVVVSGFLGSGKTTFILRSLLPRLKGRKISVVVNDFGEINYDRSAIPRGFGGLWYRSTAFV